MTASRTLIAAACSTRNGFSYNEFETVDADSMISDLAADGYTAWICGEVAVKVAAPAKPTEQQKAAAKLATAKEKAEAARSAKLCAAANLASALISRDAYLAADTANEKAQAALARARTAYDKVSSAI